MAKDIRDKYIDPPHTTDFSILFYLGQLDDVVGTRTRAINRQLLQVESLPVGNVDLELPALDIPTTKDELDE